MTIAVFVHGVPETAAIWNPLIEHLGTLGVTDTVCLSPPGFGANVPDGWVASPDAYRDWLINRLETFNEPVDLVGHDWGGGHALAAVMQQPALVRSWAVDVVGLFDPDYVWHPLAQTWQTPGDGERAVEQLVGMSESERAEFLETAGMSAGAAAAVSPDIDEAMGRSILQLYRAAAQPAMARAGTDLAAAAARPGLCILAGADDVVGTDEQRRRSAARVGATTVELPGANHWWMTHDPAGSAAVLTDFWRTAHD